MLRGSVRVVSASIEEKLMQHHQYDAQGPQLASLLSRWR